MIHFPLNYIHTARALICFVLVLCFEEQYCHSRDTKVFLSVFEGSKILYMLVCAQTLIYTHTYTRTHTDTCTQEYTPSLLIKIR